MVWYILRSVTYYVLSVYMKGKYNLSEYHVYCPFFWEFDTAYDLVTPLADDSGLHY